MLALLYLAFLLPSADDPSLGPNLLHLMVTQSDSNHTSATLSLSDPSTPMATPQKSRRLNAEVTLARTTRPGEDDPDVPDARRSLGSRVDPVPLHRSGRNPA